VSGKPIYYATLLISYKKKREVYRKEEWAVTTYTSASDIMRYDKKTMESLSDRLYGSIYKGERSIIVLSIKDKKTIGLTNS
jgi:hypothetical protein